MCACFSALDPENMFCWGCESLCQDEICQVIKVTGSSCTHWLEENSYSTCSSHSTLYTPLIFTLFSFRPWWSWMVLGPLEDGQNLFLFKYIFPNYSFSCFTRYHYFHLDVPQGVDIRRFGFPSALCDLRSCVREKRSILLTSRLCFPACFATVRPHELFLRSNISWSKAHEFSLTKKPDIYLESELLFVSLCSGSTSVFPFLCNNKTQAQYDNAVFICCWWELLIWFAGSYRLPPHLQWTFIQDQHLPDEPDVPQSSCTHVSAARSLDRPCCSLCIPRRANAVASQLS